eukprot:c13843_g1_i1 orf=105-1238(+)
MAPRVLHPSATSSSPFSAAMAAPPSLDCCAESLLCWEEDISGCLSGDGEQESGDDSRFLCKNSSLELVIAAVELQDPSDIQVAVSALIEREVFYLPHPDYAKKYETKLLDAGSRQKAISWFFKVRALYNFGPLTAALSVNYLDRFLALHQLPMGKAWMIQLLSVACLSLAAKMEEVEVPLLLDLQVLPECLFEPRTIQRMELLVLSTLEWRLSSVTPFSYVDYFICKCGLLQNAHYGLIDRISELILCAVHELRFLHYRSSSVAAAATLCAIQEMLPLQLAEFKTIIFSMLPSNLQDPSDRCFKLMVELFHEPSRMLFLRAETCVDSLPLSPVGVLDASFSCDSESTFKSVGSDPSIQISSPAPKKRKVNDFCSGVP